MSGDTVFNVSGDKPALLQQTLALVLAQRGGRKEADGWYYSAKLGLVFCWHAPGHLPAECGPYCAFPAPIQAEFLAPMVGAWLKSEQARKMELLEEDEGHPGGDGDNNDGWRVYTTAADFYAICAIRPSAIYYGK